MVGRKIVLASWVTLAVFAAVVVPDALGLHAIDSTATIVSLTLFGASLAIWLYSFGLAVVRSAKGDDIAVASWVFLIGSAPADVRRQLLGATLAFIAVAIATAWTNPFGVLVPMLPLGLAALWGARHGRYPARQMTPTARVARGGRR